jgi:hypothetical protein
VIDWLRWKCPHCRAPQVGDAGSVNAAVRTCQYCCGRWRLDPDEFNRVFFVVFSLDFVVVAVLLLGAQVFGIVAIAITCVLAPIVMLLFSRFVVVNFVHPKPIGTPTAGTSDVA